MKVLLDLNVLLDVLHDREPHYAASAKVLSKVMAGELQGLLPGHAITTLYYLSQKQAGRGRAEELVDWALYNFDVVASGKEDCLRARALPMTDFEDAVVAALAERSGCDYVVSRNKAHFKGSPVPSATPQEVLNLLQAS